MKRKLQWDASHPLNREWTQDELARLAAIPGVFYVITGQAINALVQVTGLIVTDHAATADTVWNLWQHGWDADAPRPHVDPFDEMGYPSKPSDEDTISILKAMFAEITDLRTKLDASITFGAAADVDIVELDSSPKYDDKLLIELHQKAQEWQATIDNLPADFEPWWHWGAVRIHIAVLAKHKQDEMWMFTVYQLIHELSLFIKFHEQQEV